MAAGFRVTDALNKNSKAGIDESPRARFRTKDISIYKMYRNNLNFYSVESIEELAGDILMYGLKQNLEVVYAPCEKGEYRIVAGERRWQALQYLVEMGYQEFELATSKLTTPGDADEEQVEIIIANAYRIKSIADMIEEEARLKTSLERMREEGKKIKGYDLQSGRLRDVVASMLHMSKTKIAQIESINNNLIPEFREELKTERLTFSAAYELSGMTADGQREALEQYIDTGELAHKDIKNIKDKKAKEEESSQVPGQMEMDDWQQEDNGRAEEPKEDTWQQDTETEETPEVSESDTEYQTPHPEGITSLCYSCTEYETCNVKTGTCTKCDQYKNRSEAHKTEEQRYSEEQDAIDRETKRKLKEQKDQERMNNLHFDPKEEERRDMTHLIRVSGSRYEDIISGRISYEISKNEDRYQEGDTLEITEFRSGWNTGRHVRASITHILRDHTALEDGYCILSLRIINAEREGNGHV